VKFTESLSRQNLAGLAAKLPGVLLTLGTRAFEVTKRTIGIGVAPYCTGDPPCPRKNYSGNHRASQRRPFAHSRSPWGRCVRLLFKANGKKGDCRF